MTTFTDGSTESLSTQTVPDAHGKGQSSRADFTSELKRILRVTSDNWPILGAISLVFSCGSIYRYLDETGVPLSVASSDFIAAAPVLMVPILAAVLVLAVSAALPSASFLSRSGNLKNCLLDEFFANAGKKAIWYFFIFRCAGLITVFGLADFFVLRAPLHHKAVGWLVAVLLPVAVFASEIASVALISPKGNRLIFLKDRMWVFALLAVPQVLLWAYIGIFVQVTFAGTHDWIPVALIAATLALCLYQYACAIMFWHIRQNPVLLQRACAVAAVAVLAILHFSPGWHEAFVGPILTSGTTGGRKCIVIKWTPNSQVLPELHAVDNQTKSVPLIVPMVTSDMFYVRPLVADPADGVFMVPASAVGKIQSCKSAT